MQKERNADVTEWEVYLVIVSLVGFAIAVGTPIIKLNTSITRLIDRLNNLDESMDELTVKNSKSHERLWNHNEKQDELIKDHGKRIIVLEEKEK